MMICPKCKTKFEVTGWTQDYPGHCSHEDINCPKCKFRVTTARNDWGMFTTYEIETDERPIKK